MFQKVGDGTNKNEIDYQISKSAKLFPIIPTLQGYTVLVDVYFTAGARRNRRDKRRLN